MKKIVKTMLIVFLLLACAVSADAQTLKVRF